LKESIIEIYQGLPDPPLQFIAPVEPPDLINEKLIIAETILELATSNAFLAKINARLYKDMVLLDSNIFLPLLQTFLRNYEAEMEHGVISREGLDEKLELDKRKSKTMFFIHFYLLCCDQNQPFLPQKFPLTLVLHWLSLIQLWSEQPNNTEAVEELSEHIYLYIQHTYSVLSDQFPEEYDDLYDKISILSEKKAKDWPSLSNRAIFKFRDLIDLI
jgi:hypothetical protein